jgi:hypothetical protein
MRGLGPSFVKILTCGSSPRSGSRNAWTRVEKFNLAVPVVWATFGFFDAIQMIAYRARLVTMDETWLYRYDPQTNQQSMEWRHGGSQSPQNFLVQKSARKFLASNFWDQYGILLIDYLQRLMDVVSRNLTGLECYVFTDDVIVYADSIEVHARRLSHCYNFLRKQTYSCIPKSSYFLNLRCNT